MADPEASGRKRACKIEGVELGAPGYPFAAVKGTREGFIYYDVGAAVPASPRFSSLRHRFYGLEKDRAEEAFTPTT
jgi:hypothetical protein